MPKVLGIDLGTTNSAMAYLEGGQPEILVNAEGERTTPSIVALAKDSELLVGRTAKRQAVLNPDQTVISIKRKMGTNHHVKLDGKDYTPPQLSAFILQKLKRDAEARLGEAIPQAVITCPAYFTDAQRQATKDAGVIAGFEVLRIINEPTAAALAYGFKDTEEKTIMVFDLGGGTFDVSILETGQGVFQVKATSGDNHLGGDDFDQRLVEHFTKKVRDLGVDVTKDRQALQRLREAAEGAKIELSSKTRTQVSLPFIGMKAGTPVHLDVELTRAEMERLCADLLQRLEGPTRQAMQDAAIAPGRLSALIMVGGMTRMPAVIETAHKLTGVKPDISVNPDEAVAVGAAIQAGVITGEVSDLLLLDVTPLTLGIETLGGRFTPMIERNTTIPTTKKRIFSTADDGQTRVDVHVLQGERPMARDNKHLGNFILDGLPPAPRGMPQIEVAFDMDVNGILQASARDLATKREQRIVINEANRLSDDEVERMRKDAERFAADDQRRAERIDAANEAETLIHSARRTLADAKDLPGEIAKPVEAAIADVEEALRDEQSQVASIKERTEALRTAVLKVGEHLYTSASAGASARAREGEGRGEGEGGPGPGTGDGPRVNQTPEDAPHYKRKKGEGDNAVDVEYEVKDDD